MSSERSISPDPIPMKARTSGSGAYPDGQPVPVQSSSRAPKRYRASASHSRSRSVTRSRSPRSLSRSATPRSLTPDEKATAGSVVTPGVEAATASLSKHRHETSSKKKKSSKRRSGSTELERYDCGICLDNVPNSKRLFGILDNCDHVFCYECIVGWKRSKYSNHESASCPVCKTRSSFITPSKHWFENKEDKYKLVKKHKNHLKTLPCRYYLRHGFCRFSDRCFYDHHEAARQYRQQHGSSSSHHRGDSYSSRSSHYYHTRSPSPRESYRHHERRERAY